MSSGPVAVLTVGTSDVSAPGSPLFGTFTQISNTTGEVDIQLPGADADGSTLTGLKHLSLAIVAGVDPLAGQSPDQIIGSGALIIVTPLTDSDAGTVKTLPVTVLNAGEPQTFYAWCDDNAS